MDCFCVVIIFGDIRFILLHCVTTGLKDSNRCCSATQGFELTATNPIFAILCLSEAVSAVKDERSDEHHVGF